MPIYKMEGKKNGLQKYRVLINYTDKLGKAKQLDRVAYGKDDAKALEIRLTAEYIDGGNTSTRMTVAELFDEYISTKQHELRDTTLDKVRRILRGNVIETLGD